MTLSEFMEARHHDKDISNIRFKAKAINFGFEFGSSGFAFAHNVLLKEWTKEEVQDYVREHDLESAIDRLRDRTIGGSSVDAEFLPYWAVGSDIRRKFFDQYQGLKHWVEHTPEIASEQGYIQSPFGAIRRFPQLVHFGEDGKNNFSSVYKNLRNQSLNSPVQNFEIVLIVKTINGIKKFIEENHLNSRVFITIHDSIILYLHKDEVEIITKKLKEIFEEDIPENNGVPMELEGSIADYFEKGEVWGEGYEV